MILFVFYINYHAELSSSYSYIHTHNKQAYMYNPVYTECRQSEPASRSMLMT